MLVLLLVATRLAALQIIGGPQLAMEALRQRAEIIPLEVPRGGIYDRNMVSLTGSYYRQRVLVFPGLLDDLAVTAAALAGDLGLPPEELARMLVEPGTRPVIDLGPMTAGVAARIAARNLPGLVVTPEKVRYGENAVASHLIGYISPTSGEGVSGLEASLDSFLRGAAPEAIMAFFDALGRPIRGLGLGYRPGKDGSEGRHDVILTLDRSIQETVERLMDAHIRKGAVVVVEAQTGDVLALASRPGFDQALLNLKDSSPGERDRIRALLRDSDGPLVNRAVLAYPPGSVFKIVVAAAALEKRLVKLQDRFFCRGYIDVGNLRFKGYNFEQGGHGLITFEEALAYSSNPVFIEVGLRVGARDLLSMARELGLGQETGLDLFEEATGVLPEPEPMFAGDVANISIGQGRLTVTPLQMAQLMTAVAGDGLFRPLRLVKEIRRPSSGRPPLIVKRNPVSRPRRVFSSLTASQLKMALQGVTTYGTGTRAFVSGYGAAGKTGTAETGELGPGGAPVTHAWFAGFAPLYDPRYVIVVFIEGGSSGGGDAAPVFGKIAEALLHRN